MYHYESVLHNLSLTRKFNFKIICSIEEKLGLETFVRLFILLLVDLSLDLSKVFRVPVVLKDSMTGTQAGETRNWPISPIKSVHEMSKIWTRVSLFSVSTLGYSQSQVSLWQNNAPLHKQNELLTSSRASSAGLNVVPGACACVCAHSGACPRKHLRVRQYFEMSVFHLKSSKSKVKSTPFRYVLITQAYTHVRTHAHIQRTDLAQPRPTIISPGSVIQTLLSFSCGGTKWAKNRNKLN